MTKIIVDVTELRNYISKHAQLSGIQRVMVMLIEALAAHYPKDKLWLGYCGDDASDYRMLPYSFLAPQGAADLEKLAHVLDAAPRSAPRPSLEGYAKKPAKRIIHTVLRDLNAKIGNEDHFRKRNLTIEEWRASNPSHARHKPIFETQAASKVCEPGDWVVLLDAGWLDPSWNVAKNWRDDLREKGVKIALMVHDLIQMQNPEYISGTDPMRFYKWLLSTLQSTDLYLANSQATAKDLHVFLASHEAERDVAVLPLAQEALPRVSAPRVHTKTDIPAPYAALATSWDLNENIRALLKWPFVLCVGTMEARKNLWALAQVWDQLRAEPGVQLPKLVFAGRKGWLNADFEAFMQATGRLGGWIEICESPTDQELDFLYRHCLFTATPSFYEGWGLPIGEGLSYGKTGVVSQTSSMPEVGGNLVEYFDPHDLSSIKAACLKLISDSEHRGLLEAKIAKATMRSWDDVGRDLLKLVA
ncbi:glycosyltransferase family 4 protein [Sulfitobacter sp. SH24]|uniref:glycosyltransferase family 4 protein n=1 Tax=Sulfitobacter sp. SH24 TaxID=3421173 RepID=UPI003F50906C